MRRLTATVLVLAAALAGAPAAAPAAAPPAPETVVAFDPARGELPEGIAFDRHGTMLVSLAPLGEIRRFGRDGVTRTVATIPPGTSGLGVLGLAMDRHDRLVAAAPTDDPAWHGVVAVSPRGELRRLPGTQAITFPNAIARDPHGALYVTDSVQGAVWRISRRGHVRRWLQHPSLTGTGALGNPFPVGANGITYTRGGLVVANLERRLLVRIPIRRSGAPGRPRVLHAYAAASDLPDGVVADRRGDLYVAVGGANRVDRLRRDGRLDALAGPEDGLDVPASLAFGPRRHGHRTLYVTSFALPAFSPAPRPAVVAVPVR